VSEDVGLTSNDDDVDLDLDEDVTVDVKSPLKTPISEHDFSDSIADKADLPTASDVDCQDNSTVALNPGSSDQQNQKVSGEPPNEANCESNNESLSQTCSGSPAADLGDHMTRNIPGKALPVGVDSVNQDLSAVDTKCDDSMSDVQDTTKVQSSESEKSEGIVSSAIPGIYTTDVKSKNLQQSKKCDTKSVSVLCQLLLQISYPFYPRDAMLARVFAIATCLSVCPSVRPSATRRYCA